MESLIIAIVLLFLVLCVCKTIFRRIGRIVLIVASIIFTLPLVVGLALVTILALFGRV